jgi:hypothetical protein
MKIILTNEESETIFHNALCSGVCIMSDHGLRLEYNKADYASAREELIKANPNNALCYEDILLKILQMGYKLTLVDEEGDGAYTSEIGIDEVHERVQLAPARNLINMVTEVDDAEDADVIIQTVFLNEVIFG